jgi:hypothetical protein
MSAYATGLREYAWQQKVILLTKAGRFPGMRFNLFICLISILILSSCAYEGTVVRKDVRPLPFYDSLGIDAIYHFELRDRAGQIHSQMVTPQVFAAYEVGDYFNDLQLPADVRPAAPSPIMGPFPSQRPLQYYDTPYRPLHRSGLEQTNPQPDARIALNHESARTKSVSQRSAHKHSAVAKTHHRMAHKAKLAKKKHPRNGKKVAAARKHKKAHSKVVRSHRSAHRDDPT